MVMHEVRPFRFEAESERYKKPGNQLLKLLAGLLI